jgi:hypothetical protein
MNYSINIRSKYRYTLQEDYSFTIDGLDMKPRLLCFQGGRVWLEVEGDKINIKSGYSWDGCSPKVKLPFLNWIGTPDFKESMEGSLVHDALYQFHKELPITKDQADRKFLSLMNKNNFKFAEVYYLAVVWFGWFGKKDEQTYSYFG